MNKGHPISMIVRDRPVMKRPQFHTRGGKEGDKEEPHTVATFLDVMMQRERERCTGLLHLTTGSCYKPAQDIYTFNLHYIICPWGTRQPCGSPFNQRADLTQTVCWLRQACIELYRCDRVPQRAPSHHGRGVLIFWSLWEQTLEVWGR